MNINVFDKIRYDGDVNINKDKMAQKSVVNTFSDNYLKSISGDKEEDEKTEKTAAGHIGIPLSNLNIKSVVQYEGISVCDIQNISYEGSDYVRTDIENGCVYKAKVIDDGVVYVEKKSDDGSVEAYEICTESVNSVDFCNDKAVIDLCLVAKEAAVLSEKAVKNNDEVQDVNDDFHEQYLKFYEYVRNRIENGPPKFSIGKSEFTIDEWDRLLEGVDEQIDEIKDEIRQEEDEKNKCGYFKLADKNGIITYNGVSIVCDYEKNALCIGDTSNMKNVITIFLSGGGCIKVNRNNIGSLAGIIGMFSAEDQGRIMRAIAEDAQIERTKNELEEMENSYEL